MSLLSDNSNIFTKTKNIILDILFPPACFGCRKYLEDRNKLICDGCLASIKYNNTLFCPACQARLPENKRICRHDPEKTAQFPFLLAAASTYDSKIIQDLIHSYKYGGYEKLSELLGETLTNYINLIIGNLDLEIRNFSVTYIPLHFFREKKRGFNQSKLLAKIISKNFNLELIDALKRIKNNPPQAQAKNYDKRQEGISNAFQITNPDQVKNRNIILIDDVYTSGATMSAAAKILKQNGAKDIIALVIAKA